MACEYCYASQPAPTQLVCTCLYPCGDYWCAAYQDLATDDEYQVYDWLPEGYENGNGD